MENVESAGVQLEAAGAKLCDARRNERRAAGVDFRRTMRVRAAVRRINEDSNRLG
jgi:hypothetical protein